MKLFFSGAAHEVTGSKHYLEAAGKKILIDCGYGVKRSQVFSPLSEEQFRR